MSCRTFLFARRIPAFLIVACLAVSPASAVTITSSNFSLGFGSTESTLAANPGTWTTLETNDTNTPDTGAVGVDNANATAIAIDTDFTLTPTVLGQTFSGIGPVFLGRALADGAGGSGANQSGYSFDFEATLAAAYTGVLPAGATNVQTTLNITSISIYAVAYNGITPRALQFFEPGAGTSSPVTEITASPSTNVALVYTQVAWDPAEVAALGTSANRNFNVTGFGDSATTAFYSLEGFEVEGNVVVTYDVTGLVPGDFDGDGDVDGADFVVWQTNFPKATGGTLDTGDADGDGDVDGADFVVWQTNFPFTPSPGVTAVPEPASVALFMVAGAAIVALRRMFSGNLRQAI